MEETGVDKEASATHQDVHERIERMDFIRATVAADQESGKYGGRVVTRFPPEPNGFLHIGHAKSIGLNFGVAADFDGVCNLRFDDTNPETEDMAYVEAIQRDLRWLGYEWEDRLYFASDYFDQLFAYAIQLIEEGKAYVDSLSDEEIRAYRGTVTEAGKESPYRNRSVEENLNLFHRMAEGEFPDGAHVLRAKIDIAAPNMKMRDPLLYRIRHAEHYRTGDAWCIYPMYDFAHPLSDAIEGVTHSICTLEFENNREIYDWLMDHTQQPPRPHQYEFARLNLDYTIMSKRKLLQLVEEGYVDGWDDPRMPTIAGLRRRGVTPEAIRTFSESVGVAKANSRVDISLLEHCIRDDLNYRARRVLGVLRPLKVIIDNYPAEQVEELVAADWPRDVPKEGTRQIPFTRELYIERDDFMEEPTAGFYRMAPGREVRLRYAYFVKCVDVVKEPDTGEIVEIHCTYDPDTRGGTAPDGRKVRGTIHWVSVPHSVPMEVRLYDRLFRVPNPDDTAEGQTFIEHLNPNSIEVLHDSRIEPGMVGAKPGTRYQFERLGYFVVDSVDSTAERLVFNRIIELRDSWAKRNQEATKQDDATSAQKAAKSNQDTEVVSVGSRSEARDKTRATMPELAAWLARYTDDLGLSFEDADILTGELALAHFYEAALEMHPQPQSVANWTINEVLRELKERGIDELPFGGAQLGRLVALVDDGTLSTSIGKEVFAEMLIAGEEPEAIVERRGLRQISDADALLAIVKEVMNTNAGKVEEYRAGKTGLIGFFVGQVMRGTGGKANPQVARELLEQELDA